MQDSIDRANEAVDRANEAVSEIQDRLAEKERRIESLLTIQNTRDSFLQEKLGYFLVECEKLCFKHADTSDPELLKEIETLTKTLNMRDSSYFAQEESTDADGAAIEF